MRRGRRELQPVTTTRGKATSDLARSHARLGAVPVSHPHPHPYRPFSHRRHRVALCPRRRCAARRRSTNDEDDDSDRENGAREKRRGGEEKRRLKMAFSLSQHVRRTEANRREGRQAMTTAACTSPSLSLRGAGCALALVGVHAQKHASLSLFLPSGPSLG